jgi:DNA-binding IclR family transcriptional regulator
VTYNVTGSVVGFIRERGWFIRETIGYVVGSSARHRWMVINLSVGTRLPAAYASTGKVMVASPPDQALPRLHDAAQWVYGSPQ